MTKGTRRKRPIPTENQKACLAPALNVMVSAGAGSGKTFLLVKKIGDLICKAPSQGSRVGLENVLALTFTRKAAGEMRARVYREVLERLDTLDSGPLREHLTSLKENFQAARISTIHGFASSLLRSHPVAVGVDPDFEVLHEAEESAAIETAIRSTLKDLWDSKDPGLLRVLELWPPYPLRIALEALLKSPIELNELIRTHETVDIRALLREIQQAKSEEFRSLVHEPSGLLAQIDVVSDHCREILAGSGRTKADRAKRAKADRLLSEFVAPLRELALADPVSETDAAFFAALRGKIKEIGFFRWEGMSATEIVKAFEQAMIPWFGSFNRELEALEWTRLFLSVARDAAARFEDEKRRRGRLTNDDLVIRAHDLCCSQPDTVRGTIEHILVDEFQDTDPLQWDTLRRLASTKGGGPEHLFLVGDSKQAIYGFRGADHTVTESARQMLRDTGSGAFKDHVMDENFRSLTAPLVFTNELFNRIFTQERDRSNPYEVSPQPLAALRSTMEPGPDTSAVCVLAVDSDGADQWEAEATAVVSLLGRITRGEEAPFTGISDMIRSGEPAVGILFRTYSPMSHYVSELLRLRLPFSVYHGRTFFQAPEVQTLLNLLRWLSDPEDDTALAGVLRSPLLGWTDDDLGLLARAGRGRGVPLMEKLGSAATGTEPKTVLIENAADAWELLQRLRKLSCHLSLSETLRAAMDTTSAPLIFGFGVRGSRADANIEKFLSIVREMEVSEGASALTILKAIEERIDQGPGEAEAESPVQEGGSIQLMTIHAAKGLEFPLIITACCGKAARGGSPLFSRRISLRDERGNGPIRRLTLGGIDYPDPGQDSAPAPTMLKAFLQEHDRLQRSAEEKRLLYVALTRARDHLLIPLPLKDGKFDAETNSLGRTLLLAAPEIEAAVEGEHDTVRIGEADVRILYQRADESDERAADSLDVDEQLHLIRTAPFGPPIDAPEVGELPYPRKTRLSVTEIMTFTKCPRRFYFEKFLPSRRVAATDSVISEASPSGAALERSPVAESARIVGTVVHAILEKHEQALREWEPGADPPDRIIEALESELARVSEKRASLEIIRSDALTHLRNIAQCGILQETDATAAGESRTILREVPFELEQDGFIIAGAIDRLERLPNETWHIWDYKTSHLHGRSMSEIVQQEAYDVQLQFYTWVANRILDKRVDSAGIVFTAAKDDPLFPIPVEPATVDRAVTGILSELGAVIYKGVDAFEPSESSSACESCPCARLELCERQEHGT